MFFFFFQAEDGIRDSSVTGVQTCALPIYSPQKDEQAIRPEADAFRHRAADECGRYDREHSLIHAVHDDRDVGPGKDLVTPGPVRRLLQDALQTEEIGRPSNPAALRIAERQGIAENHPL